MAIVVLDASVTLAAVLPEPNSDMARAMFARIVDESAVVPMLWPLEVANALLMAERRQAIPAGDHRQLLRWLRSLPIVTDIETAPRAWGETAELAARHQLTLYDAAYLELSVRRGLPLATFDTALRHAANAAGVELFGA